MKNILYIIILLSTISYADAQSLGSIIATLKEDNLDLKSLDYKYKAALFKGDQVNQRPDPTINAAVFPFPIETRLGAQYFKVGATQKLPWKEQLSSKKELADAKAENFVVDKDLKERELIYLVKLAYADLYELSENQKIIQNFIVNYKGLKKLALSQTESGKGSMANVLIAQMKINELENKIKVLDTKKEQSTVFLNQVLNMPLDNPIVIDENFKEQTHNTYDFQSHPALVKYDVLTHISQKEIQLNNQNSRPIIGVGLDYIMVGKRTDASPKGNGRDILIPRATITIPLNKSKNKAKENEEKIKRESYEIQKESIKTKLLLELKKITIIEKEIDLNLALIDQQMETINSTIEILESEYSAKGNGFDKILKLKNEAVNYKLEILKLEVRKYKLVAQLESIID